MIVSTRENYDSRYCARVPPRTDAPARAEAWFLEHGLPYFVDDVRADVRRRLQWSRVAAVVGVAVVLGVAAGVTVGLLAERDRGSNGFTTGVTVALVVVGLYALRALQTGTIARWAGGRALGSLGLLVPLATRALPMLLLFITFLFINTEVWQVADALSPGVLGGSVLFFGMAAVFFLVSRLGEELDDVDDLESTEAVVTACGGTPLEDDARVLAGRGEQLAVDSQVVGLERANLVLALVIAQAVQVFLLAVAVSAFFVLFGAVAIDDEVITSWIGDAPDYFLHQDVVSVQLLKVAIFLGSFSGLYFTVYAITDATYRQLFFTEILRELERAVGVRAVYRDLQDRPDEGFTGGGRPAPPAPAG
jgi:hypothetical protein